MALAAGISAAWTSRRLNVPPSTEKAPLSDSARPPSVPGPMMASMIACIPGGTSVRLVADQRRHPGLLGLGQPDPQVDAERLGDLVGDEGAERATVDPADQLAGEPAVGQGVVAVPAADRPLGCGGGERAS